MANGIFGTNTDILQVEVNRDYSGASGIFVDNVNNIISITGDVGKVYSGVDPIVVNNEENLISANSAPIGVQEPLYFVQDDDEALIIGLSGGTGDEEVNELVRTNSGTWNDVSSKLDSTAFSSVSSTFLTAVDLTPYVPVSSIGTELYDGVPVVSSISGYKISAFEAAYATYATNSYESQYAYTAYVANNAHEDSNGNVISSYYQPKLDFTGIDGTITAINNSALAGGGTTYTSPSGTILVVDDTLEGTTSALEKTVKTVSVHPGESYFSAIPGYPFDRYILNREEDKGGYAVILYGNWEDGVSVTVDNNFENPFEIPLTSAGFNLSTYQGHFSKISAVKSEVVELALKSDLPTYQYDSSNKISAINGSAIAGGEFPASANEAITTYQTNSANYLTAVNIPESATWNTVVDKLDTTAFSTVSGDFLTAHQDLSNYYKKTETSSKDEISNALQYVSANAGKVYEGVSPIVVNNVENKVSADTWTLSAGNNVTFVDDNVNKITRIDVELPTYQYDEQDRISAINNSAVRYPDSSALLPYPMAFVSTSSEATGTNILYVVTGTGA